MVLCNVAVSSPCWRSSVLLAFLPHSAVPCNGVYPTLARNADVFAPLWRAIHMSTAH